RIGHCRAVRRDPMALRVLAASALGSPCSYSRPAARPLALTKRHETSFRQSRSSGLIQMKADMKSRRATTEVAAFPDRRLRHFQKQGSVKEELRRSGSRVRVELKLRRIQVPK